VFEKIKAICGMQAPCGLTDIDLAYIVIMEWFLIRLNLPV
jgi:hypothetical protein